MTADDMTAADMTADITTGDMAAAIAAATGDDALSDARITAATTLEGDLCLDSLDLAALGALLRDRYGTAVDLAGYVAGLDIDEIIGLSVGEVTGYVNRCLRAARGSERPPEQAQ